MKNFSAFLMGTLQFLMIMVAVQFKVQAQTQSVTEIITDYQGYWKSGSSAINPIKPQNSHNLLSFTSDGQRYSTGVNDDLLSAQGQAYSPQQFMALSFQYFSGTPTAETFIGLGQLYDGVNNGGSTPPPVNNIPMYLMDGLQGLDIGTCIANIPSGSIRFAVSSINPANIGDGIPDILITQIAQPSGATDTYTFRNSSGDIVGTPINIVLNDILPVGNWTADFYRVISNPMVIPAGFVNTDRPLRLWAADLSALGITAANYEQVSTFNINLKGTSDIAFIAYNNATTTIIPLTPDVSLLKEGTYSDTNGNCIADAGDTINYTFQVTNTGDAALSNVTITDPNATITGGPIALAPGATNTTAFTGTHIISAAEAASGAVYNLATVSATSTHPQTQVTTTITSTSQDPTPIGSTSPYYNAACPDCTVVVLPPTATITAPAPQIIEGCGTASITGLPYSTTSASITLAQFLAAGGTTSLPDLPHVISYIDVATGTCPTVVTRTFTVTDGCLVRTFTQTITVDDTTNPAAANPANITVQGCNQPFPAPNTALVTATDNCGTPTVAWVSDSAPETNGCSESIIRTYSVTDSCLNSINVTQTITRTSDVIPPTASNPADINLTTFNQPVPQPDPAVVINEADNCGVPTVAFVQDSAPTTQGCTVTIVRTYSVTDACQNTIFVTQNIIRNVDNEAPATPVLAPVSAQCQITLTAPTTTDNCVGVVTGTTTNPTTYTTPGTYTVTWTFDDGNGNSTTATQTVTIDNATAPTAPQLNDVVGQCSATATAPTVVDGCTNAVITGTTTDPLTYTTQGTFVIHWTFNLSDNTTVVSDQNVIVDDTQAPQAPTLPAITADCSVTLTAPTAQDVCSGTITGTTTSPTTLTPGNYTVTWTFDDGNGNTSTATQQVTVAALVPATPVLADVTGQCSAAATAPTVVDPCTNAAVTATTVDATTYTTQGTFVIHWTFDLGNGTILSANQNVIVNDTEAPVAPTLAEVTGFCSAAVTAPTAQDTCEGTITGTTTDPLTYNTQGTYTVTWTFTDTAGNSSTATQTVTVTASAPEAPILADITGQCSASAAVPTLFDTCSNATVTGTTGDVLSYTMPGIYVIHWAFVLGNGTTITANQNVIVADTEAPVAPTLADLTGQCSATVTDVPTAQDVCGGTIAGTTPDPLTYTNQGTYVITWTFTDAGGNSSTATQNVIVNSNTAPTAPVLPNATAECSATLTAPTVVDNCTNAAITGTTTDPLTYSTQGTYTVTWSFAFSSATVTATQTVIVDDVTAPVAAVVADATGQCSVTVTAVPTAQDACAGTINGTTSDALTYDVPGTYVITWTFNDGNGNSVTAAQNVIVTNGSTTTSVPALADCNSDASPEAIINLNALLPAGTPVGGTWTDTDNSGGLNGSTFEPFQIATGTYTVTYSATNGLCPLTVDVEVTVDDDCILLPCGSITVHNALTPNGDGDNDVMIIEGITEECYVSNSIEIFNRWGVQVYESQNYNNTSVVFRGISEGRSTFKKNEELPSGTYFYILKYTGDGGQTSSKSGYLYISR